MFEWECHGPNRPQDRRRGTHEGVSENLTEDYLLTYRVNINGKADLVSLPSSWICRPGWGDEQHRRQFPQGGSRGLHLHVRKGDDRTTSGIQGQVGSRALEEGGTQTSIRTRRYHHHRRRSNCVWCLRLMYKYCLPQFERISALRGRRANCHGSSRPSAGKRRDMVMTTVNDESSGPIVEARPVRGLQWIE